MLGKSASIRRPLFGLSGLSGLLVERNYPDESNKPNKPDKPDKPEKPNKPDRLGLPKRIGAARNGNIALSDEYEGGKERIVIAMLTSRFDSHIIRKER